MITLLTDFGTHDTFVGVLKGVIKSIAPTIDLIDLTHEIPAYNIYAAAFALKTAYRYFPSGTVHLIVVDPGVGSKRRPIAAQIGERFYVCPDNGVLSHVLQEEPLIKAVILDNPKYQLPNISRTFHGRDLFAPVAAYLANGTKLSDLGTPLSDLLTIPLSHPIVSDTMIIAHVIYFDHYGNAFTDLTERDFVQQQGHTFFHYGQMDKSYQAPSPLTAKVKRKTRWRSLAAAAI